ncbi:unnamed protein product, partial [Ectocarpus sp. 12 AP-2014]
RIRQKLGLRPRVQPQLLPIHPSDPNRFRSGQRQGTSNQVTKSETHRTQAQEEETRPHSCQKKLSSPHV